MRKKCSPDKKAVISSRMNEEEIIPTDITTLDDNPQQRLSTKSQPYPVEANLSPSDSHNHRLCSKMVKFTSMTIFIAFFLILILTTIVIYGEPQSPETRSKARSVRKKKTSVPKAKLELTTTTTITPNLETDESQSTGFETTKVTELLKDVEEMTPDVTSEATYVSTTQTPVTTNNMAQRTNTPPPRTGPIPEGCRDCDQEDCNTPTGSSCPNGLVLDRCSCCFVCGALEGNRCYNSSLNLPYNPDVGICGPHLDCLLREDLDSTEPREALCECRDNRIVCGNDHKTYLNECKLREAAHSTPRLTVASWSPCVSAPVMTTPVENMTVAIGTDVSLSCEVRAYPAPILHWEFLAEGSIGAPQILPGDDSGIVVVVRGSELSMTTSWIQIIDVNPKRQGIYFCVAKNGEGSIQTSAEIRVYKSFDDE